MINRFRTPYMLQVKASSWRKVAFINTCAAALAGTTACAPLQNHSRVVHETHAQAMSYKAQSAHKSYGFNTHNLDNPLSEDYEISRITQLRQGIKLASASETRLSPYLPADSARRFETQNYASQKLNESNLEALHLDKSLLGQLQVNSHFEPHLDGPAPQGFTFKRPKAASIKAAPIKVAQASVINARELDKAVDVSPQGTNNQGANPFETRSPQNELTIPKLPEAQKQIIRDEQAALLGLEDKSVLAGSISLRQSLDSAFARSSRLAAENLRIDEAEEVLKQAKSQSKPRLEFRSTVGPRQSETTFAFNNNTISATSIRRSAELDLSLPIYQGGRLRAQRSSAELGIETARAAVSQTRGQIIEETALAYLDVVRDRQLTDLYKKNVDLLREQQTSLIELLALNESTIAEKALVDAQLATQRIRLETGLGMLRESEARYRNLVGQAAPQDLPVPSFNLPISLIEIQALAQQNNPELTALISRAKSAEYDIDIAKSGNKPNLSLQGVVRGAEGQSETIDRNAAAELLLNLRVPISTGGEGQSRVRQAKIIRNRLALEIRDTQDRLRDQIDGLWARKTASERSQGFNKSQIEATQFAVDTIAQQRAEGVATVLDLLNVQQTLLDAQIQTVQAKNRQDTTSVQLLNFMGVY